MKAIFGLVLLALFMLLPLGCESTGGTGYGYMATGLNEESIVELFAVSDAAINEQDYVTYSSLLGPGYTSRDSSSKFGATQKIQSKVEYLDEVKPIFDDAKYVRMYTTIMTMEFDEQKQTAKVKVREEQDMDYQGRETRYVSLVDVEVGYEDGWVFFKSSDKTAMQEIR